MQYATSKILWHDICNFESLVTCDMWQASFSKQCANFKLGATCKKKFFGRCNNNFEGLKMRGWKWPCQSFYNIFSEHYPSFHCVFSLCLTWQRNKITLPLSIYMWRVIQGFKTFFIFSYFNPLMVMLIHIEVHDINTHCYNVDINSNLHFVD